MIQPNQIHITADGLEKLQRDLDYLILVRRVELAEILNETASGGDNLDNTEYQAALYEQLMLESRIEYLQRTLAQATLIQPGNGSGLVNIGTRVDLLDENNQLESYMIVGPIDADPFNGRISYECPLGKALLNRQAGEWVYVNTPDGVAKYQIIAVS